MVKLFARRGNISIIMLFALIVAAGFISWGCKRKDNSSTPKEKARLHIVASFLPMWIFTANIINGAEGVKLDCLLPPEGASPHEYSMTPGDVKKLADADVLIINGLGIESFMGDSYRKVNPKIKIIDASAGVQTLPDVPTGREWEVGPGGHEGHAGEEGSHAYVFNPHVWVSPFRAIEEVNNIALNLAAIDPANADLYKKNAAAYVNKLQDLGNQFKTGVAALKNKNIVTVHNAFDYLAADTGLEIVAVLRVDATSEPRAAELAAIADKVKTSKVGGIFAEPQVSAKLADVLSQETGVPVSTLNPIDTGELRADYYESTMRANLSNLEKVLGKQ